MTRDAGQFLIREHRNDDIALVIRRHAELYDTEHGWSRERG